MKSFFKELFEYNHYCNQKLFDVFITNAEDASKKSLNLFNHILNAHQIWNNRIDARQSTFGVWEMHDTNALKNIDTENYNHSLNILENVDLAETRAYTNSKGQAFGKITSDMLFHVINHSTYHRAQIATEFRQHGLEPLVTDYILYKR